ncbi:PREDICTED: pleckstrin homology domain-containing family A member 5-like [Poecilia mexicana]|uniref:pleckstrin homology domain-containing family A member 5-like n=1 Tax=Poecilia mexicana TaxID=48701 RepID=UPI00072E76CF|nr:PREDICTED: pleckstrin homology domain-containing family A member 5-like [Poecilia mexicana]
MLKFRITHGSSHNERKVTCKHPVSGIPSQDNCIFVVNEQPAPKASAEQESSTDKNERPMSIMSEASNYTGGSDYSTFPGSPATTVTAVTTTSSTRPSRSSKKVHNFGKRSNSIKRNLNAPVVKRNWLYKQDSTGMKLWKKRWFVLSDMCLFYYRGENKHTHTHTRAHECTHSMFFCLHSLGLISLHFCSLTLID